MNACRTCSHPQKEAIDAALRHGESTRAVADQYGLPESTLRQHRDRHVNGRKPGRVAGKAPAKRPSAKELDANIAALVRARDEDSGPMLPSIAKEIRESLRVRRLWEAEDAQRAAEEAARLGARALDQPGVAAMLDRLLSGLTDSARSEVIEWLQRERDATDPD